MGDDDWAKRENKQKKTVVEIIIPPGSFVKSRQG